VRALQGGREPQADQIPLPGGAGASRSAGVTGTFSSSAWWGRPGVVVPDPGIDRGLRFLDRGKGPGGVEEVRAEGAVEALYLPVLVR